MYTFFIFSPTRQIIRISDPLSVVIALMDLTSRGADFRVIFQGQTIYKSE